MLGITHVIANAALAVHMNLTAEQVAAVAVGSLMPDLDTPTSTASRLLPRSQIFRYLIGAYLVFSGLQSPGNAVYRGSLLLGVFLIGGTFFPHRTVTHSLLGLAIVTALSVGLVPGYWVYVTAGYAMHLVEDMLTPAGIPILWPIPLRPSLGIPSWFGNVVLLAAGILLILS